MSKQSERVMAWRKNTKAKLLAAFGGKCAICGYCKCSRAMDFHHLDPSTKETTWGAINGSIRGWNYIVAEMEKCVLLCSNCHSEVHDGLSEVPADVQRFDKSLIPVELLKIHQKITRPKVVEKRVNRYEGHDLIKLHQLHKNYRVVGDMFGVTGAAIKRRIDYIQKWQSGNVSDC